MGNLHKIENTEYRRQRAEGGGRRTEHRIQNAEHRTQKTEGGRRWAEGVNFGF
jgi:hypothetical protein